jgi:tetratricopeptide (TPR) repeat protein
VFSFGLQTVLFCKGRGKPATKIKKEQMVKTPKENTMAEYEEYLKKREWELAERNLTELIGKNEKDGDASFKMNGTAISVSNKKQTLKISGNITKNSSSTNDHNLSDLYFNRAKARCFIETKEHRENNYKDVIDDCSQALLSGSKEEGYLLRAYAYYLSKNYASALDDCKKVIGTIEADVEVKVKDTKDDKKQSEERIKLLLENNTLSKAKSLLATIYQKLGDYEKSYQNYGEALSESIDDLPSTLLMDKYLEARKKLNKE